MKHGSHVRGGLPATTPIQSPVTSLEPPLPGPPGSRGRLASRGLLTLSLLRYQLSALTWNCCFAPLGVQPDASELLPCPCQV